MTAQIKVKIFNNEYLIKAEEDTEYVKKITEYVNQKIDEISNGNEGLSEKKTAILAALNIASEYFQLLKDRDDLLDDIRSRSNKLILDINSKLRWKV